MSPKTRRHVHKTGPDMTPDLQLLGTVHKTNQKATSTALHLKLVPFTEPIRRYCSQSQISTCTQQIKRHYFWSSIYIWWEAKKAFPQYSYLWDEVKLLIGPLFPLPELREVEANGGILETKDFFPFILGPLWAFHSLLLPCSVHSFPTFVNYTLVAFSVCLVQFFLQVSSWIVSFLITYLMSAIHCFDMNIVKWLL